MENKEHPNSWAVVPLGDFVENEKGKKPRNQKEHPDQHFIYPYVDIEAFEKGNIRSWTDGDGCRLCNEDDFLMVWDGSRSGLVGKGMKGALGSTLVRINFPKINNHYAFYFLQSKYSEINTRAKGVGIPHVDPNLLWNYNFPIAPLNEQKRIVAKIEELFSELDKGIESLKTACEQLKVYRQAVLKHAFEGKLTADWREENKDKLKTADNLLERIKQERKKHFQKIKSKRIKNPRNFDDEDFNWLPELPKNWAWNRLGWTTCGVEYGTSAKSSKTGEMPVLRMGNIQNAKFDWNDLVFTSDSEEIKKYELKPGNVLFNRTNSPELVGKTAMYRGEQPAIFAGYLIRVNQIESIVDAQFLNLFLNSYVAKQYGNRVKTDGVNQSNINGEKLINYPFPYCSLEEQKIIVEILEKLISEIDRMESEVDIQLQKSETLRQSILKKAFSGKLVAQDPNDEPASVLLERIKAEKESNVKHKKRNAA